MPMSSSYFMPRRITHTVCVAVGALLSSWFSANCAPDAVLTDPVIEDGRAEPSLTLRSAFPEEPDDPAGACAAATGSLPLGECDPYLQDCPEPAVCKVTASNEGFTTLCVAPVGGDKLGEDCIAGSCENHLSCIWGKCSVPCCPEDNAPCEAAGGMCTLTTPVGPYTVRVCSFLEACDLFTPGSCPGDSHCHLQANSYGDARCIPPANSAVRAEGEPCDYVNHCGDAQGCDTGTCRYYCELVGHEALAPGAGGCPEGQRCVTNTDYESLGYGVCIP
jgi:hypothetical protein